MIGSYSASGLGFGLAFTLEDEFSRTSREIRAEMERLGSATDSMSRRMTSSLDRMSYGFASLSAGIATLIPLIAGISKSGDMEQLEIAMSTMLKSVDKARYLIAELRKFADLTPFVDEDVLKAGRMLVAYGKQAEDVIRVLNNLGNVASGVGISMTELVTVYGKNLSQPSIRMEDIWEITNRGIPIIKAIADVMNISEDKVLKSVSDRLVSIEIFEEAFRRLGESGGQFEGLMNKQSESLKGRLSTFESYLSQITEYAGRSLMPIAKSLVDMGVYITDFLRKFMQTPLAATLIKIVAAMSAFALVLGTAMILSGAFRFVVMKMTLSLSDQTKALVMATIAGKGYGAGLLMIAKNALIAYAPVLKLMGVLGLVYVIGRYMGVWERLAKYMEGIAQALRSFNGETFELEGAYAARMESEGLLDNVVALSTWAIRLKQLFSGMFIAIKTFFIALANVIMSVIEKIPILREHIERNTTDLKNWTTAGKILGYTLSIAITSIAARYTWLAGVWIAKNTAMVASNALLSTSIGGIVSSIAVIFLAVKAIVYMWNEWGIAGKILAVVLGMLTAAFTVFKAVMIIVNAVMYANPIVWVIAMVIALIAAIALLIIYWEDVVNWMKKAIDSVMNWIAKATNAVYGWAASAWNAGKSFVMSLWNGMISVWESFKNWVIEAWDSIIEAITSSINWVSNAVGLGDTFDVNRNERISVENGNLYPSSGDVRMARDNVMVPYMPVQYAQASGGNLNVTLEMDGSVVAQKVIDYQNIEDSRGGTINGR